MIRFNKLRVNGTKCSAVKVLQLSLLNLGKISYNEIVKPEDI